MSPHDYEVFKTLLVLAILLVGSATAVLWVVALALRVLTLLVKVWPQRKEHREHLRARRHAR